MFDQAVDDFFADADYGDLDVQEGGYERFRLGQGEHKVIVAEDKVLVKKDGSRTYIIKFVNDQGQDFTEYLDPIVPGDETNFPGNSKISLKDIKRQKRVNVLVQLGVPKDQIKFLKPGDLSLNQIEGTLKLYKSKEYIRFGSFTVTKGGSVGSPLKKAEEKPLEGLADFAKDNEGDFGL